jgi:hypothetical protein
MDDIDLLTENPPVYNLYPWQELVYPVRYLERGLALSQTADFPLVFPVFASILGAAYALAGRMAEALPLLDRTLECVATGSSMLFQALVLTELGERIVKIFELACLPEVTPLPSPTLRLVFLPVIMDTHRQYGRQRLWGRGDGLETPAGVYHRDGRSGTAAAQ